MDADKFHVSDLEPRRRTGFVDYYVCPKCGPSDHYAYISRRHNLTMRPIHCWFTGWMGWVDMRMGHVATKVLEDEGTKYFRLLEKFKDLPDTLTAPESFRLWSEQGCPLDIIEDVCDDMHALESLISNHKKMSKPKHGKRMW